jgi:peptidoglycan/LPS O-acetylase OafA/YrhL
MFGVITDIVALGIIFGTVALLCRRMRDRAIQGAPYVRLSIVVIIYGSALWFVASWFLPSTGLTIYIPMLLVTLAPIVMLAIAILTFRERRKSSFHNAICLASISYFYLLVAVIVLLAKSCPRTGGGPP